MHTGTQVSPYFDSMLTKLTCRGRDFAAAVGRARRALAEFRIRGVATNIPFLQAVLDEPALVAGDLSTRFIEERPELLTSRKPQDRATKVLAWLADVTVNQPARPPARRGAARGQAAARSTCAAGPRPGRGSGWPSSARQGFARALREQTALAVTDTTFRDAHQSLLATRVRTKDLLAVAPYVARLTPELLSVEAWGGATYDVALRFLGEDPWERLAALREAMPNIALQMLLRGRNTVGYTPYPELVTRAFVEEATATGIDIFRIFDALNDVGQMRPAIDAVLETERRGGRGRPVLHRQPARPRRAAVHPGLLPAPGRADRRRRRARPGRSRTWPGCCGPARRACWCGRCASGSTCRCTSTPTTPPAASSPPCWPRPPRARTPSTSPPRRWPARPASRRPPRWSPPSRTPSGTPGCRCRRSATWSRTGRPSAQVYRPFESGLPAPTGRVYSHEIPGGQLSNLRQQAIALGLADDFELIEEMYAAADRILGRIPKVTPSSKVVGDLALQLAATRADPRDFADNPGAYDVPDSVIRFMAGELGELPGGWPEPFRTKVLAGREPDLAEQPLTPEQDVGAGRPRRGASRDAQPAPLPRPGPRRSPRTATGSGTSRSSTPWTTSTACGSTRSTSWRSSAACSCTSGSRRWGTRTSTACAPS